VGLATVATTGSLLDLIDPPFSLSSADILNRANHTGTQTPSSVAGIKTVAISGNYTDLSNKPVLGTMATANAVDFATAAQGAKADTALQSFHINAAGGPLGHDPLNPYVKLSMSVTWSDIQTFNKGITQTVVTATGTAPVINANDGSLFEWTLTGNSAPSITLADGQTLTLMLDSNGYSITWPAGIKWIRQPLLMSGKITVVTLLRISATLLIGSTAGIA
jgi:hypothetical protein